MYPDLEVPLHLLDWNYVSANPDKIEWLHLSGNPNAIHLLESNLEKVYDWTLLSGNPNAIHLLEANLDKVEWDDFYSNPCSIPLLNVELRLRSDESISCVTRRRPNECVLSPRQHQQVPLLGS